MRRRLPVLGLFTAGVFAFLYVPIAVVFVNSFNDDRILARWGGFTLSWYDRVAESERVRSAFATSIKIGLLSTAISIAIAITAGLWARNARPWQRRVLDASTYMRIVLPEVVLALGLFVLFRRLDVELGVATIVAGHVVFNSALATLVIQARLVTLTTDLEEAAADLGAPPWRVFRRVTLPLLMPAVVVAALITFTFSFDDFITSQFLAGTGAETLPMLIFGMVRFRITPEINAIAAAAMVVTIGTLAVALFASRVWSGGLLGLRLRRDAK